MGRSSNKKKKANVASGEGSTKLDPDDAVFLKRAHELKDEGNRRFQAKDYVGAMDIYEQALKLTPEGHPDRAVFYSNRAACLLQVKPVNYENVVHECTLALEAHPKFGKALFRRARAYEAMGKLQLALSDVQTLLQSESNNQDALELGKRLRIALGNKEQAQQDTQRRSSVPLSTSPPDSANAPATPGADSAPDQEGRGPSLPARPGNKKKGRSNVDPQVTLRTGGGDGSSLSSATPNASQSKAMEGNVSQVGNVVVLDDRKVAKRTREPEADAKPVLRPLKLIFGHDIRRAEIPVNSGFGQLREVVRKRFPALKAALIKYQDAEGDLVTITSREELRLAEAELESAELAKRQSLAEVPIDESNPDGSRTVDKLQVQRSKTALELLRLHIVEVSPEQEPPVPEDDEVVDTTEDIFEEEGPAEEVSVDKDESVESAIDPPENGEISDDKTNKSVKKDDGQPAGEEMEIDDWLFDFAQLFRTHVGIDPDGHVDFHELGMELCSEALEAAVTSEEAQPLFEAAAAKFQEVAALALFNWGNVYMCAARKSMPIEEAGGKTDSKEQLQAAFEWAQGHYKLAGQKYEEALKIKPDFYEGVLALGQEKFESAKLQWAAAVAGGVDLKTWDSAETLSLFRFAEERMKTAAEMWDQLEAQQQGAQVDIISKARKEQAKPEPIEESAVAEAAEQGAAMRSQINLFWGNVLFEHSQVEYKVGLPSWKELLDAALEKFVSAGAATDEIDGALKNHPANQVKENEGASTEPQQTVDDKKVTDSNGNLGPVDDEATKQVTKVKVDGNLEKGPQMRSPDLEGTENEEPLEASGSNAAGKLGSSVKDKTLKTDKGHEEKVEDKVQTKGSDNKKSQGR
ncbi:unnamed protein product [Calypogeia fissa]